LYLLITEATERSLTCNCCPIYLKEGNKTFSFNEPK